VRAPVASRATPSIVWSVELIALVDHSAPATEVGAPPLTMIRRACAPERSTTSAKWFHVLATSTVGEVTSTWSAPAALDSTDPMSWRLPVPPSWTTTCAKSPWRPCRNTPVEAAAPPAVLIHPSIVKLLLPKKLM